MDNLSVKEEFRPLLPLEDLRKELSRLEAGSFVDLTDEELREKIRLIHTGFTLNAPIYPAGTLIYRAVRVTERPSHNSRISYDRKKYAAMLQEAFEPFLRCLPKTTEENLLTNSLTEEELKRFPLFAALLPHRP